MSFDLTAKIGADGTGYFREIDKVDRSTATLAAKMAARDFERLDHAGKLKALKEQELGLANRAFERSAAGDTQGASQATLAAMEKREQRERLITAEKEKQAALDAKAAGVKSGKLVRAESAEGELKEKLTLRADARLTPLEKEKRLKEEILKLTNDIAAIKPASGPATAAKPGIAATPATTTTDEAGREQAAKMKIQLLEKQDELQKLVTAEKEKQAQLDAKANSAEAQLKEKLAARADARLSPIEKEKSLNADILRLTNAVAAVKPVDAAGREQAAKLKIQLLEKQEALEKHITAEKEKQARLDAKAVADGKAKAASTIKGQIGGGIKEFGGGLVSGFGAPLAAGAAAYAVVDLTRKTIDYGGEINDLSARLGVSTDALQELDYAMTLNGATLGDATAAMQKLGMARVEALEKGGDKMDAFKALGISAEQLKTMRLEDLFKQVGRSVRDTADVQLVMGDAITVMGRGAGSVMAAMRADMDAAAASAQKLGLIIDADTIARLDELGDKSATMGKLMMAGLAEPLLFAMELIYKIVDGFEVAFSMAARWGEMLGKISAGVSFKVAIEEKDAGIQQDLQDIADAAEARANPQIAARGDAALAFAGEGEAAKKAESHLKIKEKIAKLEYDSLSAAEKRLALEAKLVEANEAHADVLRQIAAADPQSEKRGKVEELEAKAGDLSSGVAGARQRTTQQIKTVEVLEQAFVRDPLNDEAREKMQAAQLKLAEMVEDEASATERLNDLNERIIALKADLLANPENPELNRKLDEAKLAKMEAEKALDGLKDKDKGGKGFESRQNSDSLAKVGLFVGGSPVGVKVEPLSGPLHRQEFRNLVQALDRGVAVQVAAIERGTLATRDVMS